MTIIEIRPIRPEDARSVLEVHRAAIRVTAAKDYTAEVIEQWAPVRVTVEAVRCFNANSEGELRLVAEVDGEIAGFAAIVPGKNELRACYVAPKAGGRGVGKRLVAELESAAVQRGLKVLELVSSITAHRFYEAVGYRTLSWGVHVLASGGRMACVRMSKTL